METVNKVVDAGYKAIWGENENTASAHGDEPVSGVRGLGTPTDPYDAGNRDDQPNAPSPLAGGLPTSTPGAAQTAAGTTTTSTTGTDPDPLKTTVTSLQPDPQAPGNAANSTSKTFVDSGPNSSLKSTSEPLKEEGEKLAKDLQQDPAEPAGSSTGSKATPTPAVADTTPINTSASKATESSSSSTSSNNNTAQDSSTHKRTKSKTLEKVKGKLHIGKHSS